MGTPTKTHGEQGSKSWSKSIACRHCPHFSQALIAALKDTTLISLSGRRPPTKNGWVQSSKVS